MTSHLKQVRDCKEAASLNEIQFFLERITQSIAHDDYGNFWLVDQLLCYVYKLCDEAIPLKIYTVSRKLGTSEQHIEVAANACKHIF
jgi:hypothetical protein